MSTAWSGIPARRPRTVPVEANSSEEAEKSAAEDARPIFNRLYRSALFGGVLGGVCGVGYGIMNEWGTAAGRKTENTPKTLSSIRHHTSIFAGVFAAFQLTKEGVRTLRGTKRSDPYDPVNAVYTHHLKCYQPYTVFSTLLCSQPYCLVFVVLITTGSCRRSYDSTDEPQPNNAASDGAHSIPCCG